MYFVMTNLFLTEQCICKGKHNGVWLGLWKHFNFTAIQQLSLVLTEKESDSKYCMYIGSNIGYF